MSHHTWKVAAATLLSALALAGNAGAASYHKIQLKQNGLYLENRYCDGNSIGLFGLSLEGEPCQVWRLISQAGGYYRIQVQSSLNSTPLYLDNRYCDNKTLALAGYSSAKGGACQLWKMVPAGNGYYRMQVKSSVGTSAPLYIDNRYCDGNTLELFGRSDYDNGACQLWKLEFHSSD